MRNGRQAYDEAVDLYHKTQPRSDQILHRTMKYGDELTRLEQGNTVEREQWVENSRNPLSTMTDMLQQRYFSGRVAVLRWKRRNDYAQQDRENKFLTDPGMVQHGVWCPCDGCEDAVKRLLRDCGVLPKARAK